MLQPTTGDNYQGKVCSTRRKSGLMLRLRRRCVVLGKVEALKH